jgi:hypothetical protein
VSSKMIKVEAVLQIEVQDWDKLVQETYNRPYSFQQQDGCKARGVETINVPDDSLFDYDNDNVPEIVNHNDMGVSFAAWLERDPKQPLFNNNLKQEDRFGIELWWKRNFYPSVDMVANDLHKRGLLPAGEYQINIDW